jgi:hypothetical protein
MSPGLVVEKMPFDDQQRTKKSPLPIHATLISIQNAVKPYTPLQ